MHKNWSLGADTLNKSLLYFYFFSLNHFDFSDISLALCLHFGNTAAAAAKSLQLCPALCHPIPGILQARTLEWGAFAFSIGNTTSFQIFVLVLLVLATNDSYFIISVFKDHDCQFWRKDDILFHFQMAYNWKKEHYLKNFLFSDIISFQKIWTFSQ